MIDDELKASQCFNQGQFVFENQIALFALEDRMVFLLQHDQYITRDYTRL